MRSEDRTDARNLIQKLLEIQRVDTVRQIYESLEPGEDGKIRCVLSPGGTDTGRLSHGDTFLEPSRNLANMPNKVGAMDPLYAVREILSAPGGGMFCEADYSSAERRLLAYIAGEQRAIDQIESGIDSYRWFAARLYDVNDWRSIPKDDPKRHVGKVAVLSLDRGVGWSKLKDSVNKDAELTGATISAAKAKKAVRLFHRLFRGYRPFYDRVEREIRAEGLLVNCMGRKREFFDRRSNMDRIVRKGVSFLAQAVGDIINERIIQMYESLDPSEIRVLFQEHDSVKYETSYETWREASRKVKEIMEEPIPLLSTTPTPSVAEIVIPAEISVSTRSWGEVREVEVG